MSPALFQPEEMRPHWVWVYFPPSLEPGWREGEGGVWRAGPFLSSPMIIFGLNTQTPLEEGDAPSIGPNCGVPVPPPPCGKEELKRWVYCGYLPRRGGLFRSWPVSPDCWSPSSRFDPLPIWLRRSLSPRLPLLSLSSLRVSFSRFLFLSVPELSYVPCASPVGWSTA